MEQPLDIINENDEVVGVKTRKEVHDLGLLHRHVHVWMFDENKNTFFQRRGLDKLSAGLLDATVGGHVNQGENYLEAAIRETKEETGITVTEKNLIFIKKIRVSKLKPTYPGATLNNNITSVYMYKHFIKEEMLQKEEGIRGGGFQKLSYEFLLNPDQEHIKMFHPVIFETEIPVLTEYLK